MEKGVQAGKEQYNKNSDNPVPNVYLHLERQPYTPQPCGFRCSAYQRPNVFVAQRMKSGAIAAGSKQILLTG